MKIKIVASSSNGNCLYLELDNTRFLIDVGVNCSVIENNKINLNLVDFILITHAHNDHVSGLRSVLKKYPIKVLLGQKTHQKLDYVRNHSYLDSLNEIKNLKIYSFYTSHDVNESFGFVIEDEKESVVYLTDTGYISEKIKTMIKNKTTYILESNHDVEMLMNTKRPYHLKMRILGDKGHLSNHDSINCLCEIIGIETKKIVLVHLSEEANDHHKVLDMITKKNIKVPVTIANKEGNELIEI